MKALRKTLAVLVAATCAWLAVNVVLPRWRCNVDKTQIAIEVDALDSAPEHRRITRARELAAACLRCLQRYPDDYRHQHLLARTQQLVGASLEAEESLRRAIALNERPEFYAHLGLIQLERGEAAAARQNLLTASKFDLSYAGLVSQPLQSELYDEIRKHYKRLGRDLLP